MTHTPDDLKLKAEAERLYNNGAPNGHAPSEFGAYQPFVAELYQMHQEGDTRLVRAYLEAAASKDARLARLFADFIPIPDPWEIYTIADARRPRDPIPEIVEGMIRLPSLNILVGDGGSLKSALMMDMCGAVVQGVDWLPPLPEHAGTMRGRKTIQAGCLWVDLDNGMNTTLERVQSVADARRLPDDAPLRYVSMPDPWLNGCEEESMEALARRVKRLGARFVVIDALSDVRGIVDENSAEMGQVLLAFRRLSEDTGAAIVILHHTRKGDTNGNKPGDAMRGSSAIRNKVDLVLKVDREYNSPSITVRSIKSRGAEVKPFQALFTYAWRDGTTELAQMMFYGLPGEKLSLQEQIDQSIRAVVTRAPGINQTEVINRVSEATKAGRNQIIERIKTLVADGDIVEDAGAGPRNSSLYRMP